VVRPDFRDAGFLVYDQVEFPGGWETGVGMMNTQDLEDLDVFAEMELSLAMPGFVRTHGRLPTRAEISRIVPARPEEGIAS
jgi:hypothetical protein